MKKEPKTKQEKTKTTKAKSSKKKASRFGLVEVVILVITTMFISLVMGVIVTYSLLTKTDNITDKQLEELIEQYHYIKDNYYDEVSSDRLIDGAIQGMLNALNDDYAGFIEDGEDSSFDQELQGSYEGVGIEIYNDTDGIYVNRVFANSPASRAGIKAGDKIISIDGNNVSDKSTEDFSKYVQNKKSKNFKIVYERDGKEETVTLTRTIVVIESVTSKVYERENKKVGYLAISTFSATTTNQFSKHLQDLEKQNIDSLIIDLRGNSGGHLSVVADMLSLMMDKKHVIYQIQSKDNVKKYYSEGVKDKTYPIVVLQDGSSASASELMSSALQEQLNATVVGTSSYGKGTVQELIDLTDGNQYKFTTKKWLTSKGTWINGVGVKPNVEVTLNDKYYETGEEADDNQLEAAIREAIK